MATSNPELFINYNISAAIAPVLCMIILFGGYIKVIQAKYIGAISLNDQIAQMVGIPVILATVFFLTIMLFAIPASLKATILVLTLYLTFLGMADIFLFTNQNSRFLQFNFLLSTFLFLGFLLFLKSNNVVVLYSLSILIIVAFVSCFFEVIKTPCMWRLVLTKMSSNPFNTNFASVNIIASSALLGVFMSIDRYILSIYNNDAENFAYFAAISLALPLNFFGILMGKVKLMSFYFDSNKNNASALYYALLFGVFVFIASLCIPIQSYFSEKFLNYTVDEGLQLVVNLSFAAIVFSKIPLSELYARKRQFIVMLLHSFLVISFGCSVVLSFQGLVGVDTARVFFCILYCLLLTILISICRKQNDKL